jgi:two-component system chemotaxis response regulator CheB
VKENRKLKVLVVDDSAYVRKVVSQMLTAEDFEVVGTARDGAEALEMVERLAPDVVTCDLIMPGTDGLSFIEAQMQRRPIPIVVVSIANEAGERVLAALDAGAIDFIQKPTALATEKLLDMGRELAEKVSAAATASMARMPAPAAPAAAPASFKAERTAEIVVIGISTGGPQALRRLAPQLPANFPVPIVVVMHMPFGYTEMYAKKLDEVTGLAVSEAHEGLVLRPGSMVLAQAGRHLSFERRKGDVVCHLDIRPLNTLHRPAVDVMFQSAADVFGPRVMGVVMTGMGSDGRDGAAWIKARGGTILTESEESCVVFGMPRSVIESGLSDHSVPLDKMAAAILEWL